MFGYQRPVAVTLTSAFSLGTCAFSTVGGKGHFHPFKFGDYRGHRSLERLRQPAQDLDGRGAFSPFKQGDVGAMEPRRAGKGLLGQPRGLSPASNQLTKLSLQIGFVHFSWSEPEIANLLHRL